jgi:hypothetical protein
LVKKEQERDRAGLSAVKSGRRISQESLSAHERFTRLDLKERDGERCLARLKKRRKPNE